MPTRHRVLHETNFDAKPKTRGSSFRFGLRGAIFEFGVFLIRSKRTSSISEFRIPSRVRRALLEFATQPKSPLDHVDRPLATWTPSRSDLRPCGVDASVLDPQEKNSANQTKRWGGDVAPSCARRCAGSRLPDHARCSCFVRSRRHARVRPRRAICLSAGSMWRAHQHSHIHVWPRTTFNKGGQEAGQQRGRHQQRIF